MQQIQFNTSYRMILQHHISYHYKINYVNIYIRELKKLDDKQMLTETHLTESRIYHSLQNIPKGEYVRSLRFLWNSAYKSENITAMNEILNCMNTPNLVLSTSLHLSSTIPFTIAI